MDADRGQSLHADLAVACNGQQATRVPGLAFDDCPLNCDPFLKFSTEAQAEKPDTGSFQQCLSIEMRLRQCPMGLTMRNFQVAMSENNRK